MCSLLWARLEAVESSRVCDFVRVVSDSVDVHEQAGKLEKSTTQRLYDTMNFTGVLDHMSLPVWRVLDHHPRTFGAKSE